MRGGGLRPPLSRSIGRPGEALPPNQGVPEALTSQYHNCHCVFFRRLQLTPLGQSCYLQHPGFHLALCSSMASFTSCLQHCLQGHFPRAVLLRVSCNSTRRQENILLAFPGPTNNPTSWSHC